ncbi:MAG: hypothetical protein CL581_01650 [Alteromonadaceae bacterium]|nr:hypothetical protein [Alteromonadaceae bacterium]MBH87400.1 hypothetical protein [Alteromonadaceae bacterium]|tara:strand:- start:74597 stop:75523 length:927 start_codon:yes stop_codon:yes gene_type:complete
MMPTLVAGLKYGRQAFPGLFCALAAVLFSVPAIAEPLPVYSQSSVEVTKNFEAPNHRVLFSAVREVRGEIRADRQYKLPVTGGGRLLRIEPDSSLDSAQSFYADQLNQRGATRLFRCQGRDCGHSNAWANEIFGVSTLYGPDDRQAYTVYSYRDDQGRVNLTLIYAVTRGNLRDYLWLEELVLDDSAEIPVLSPEGGKIKGPVVMRWTGSLTHRFNWDTNTRNRVVNWMQDPDSRLIITSYAAAPADDGTVADSFERSQSAGTSLQALLEKLGVPKSRQFLVNAGPSRAAAKDPSMRTDHIELIVIKN